jgi:hypothetical protein
MLPLYIHVPIWPGVSLVLYNNGFYPYVDTYARRVRKWHCSPEGKEVSAHWRALMAIDRIYDEAERAVITTARQPR